MKPYFAKYIPVEGEIKQGDHTTKDGIIYYHHRVSHTELFTGHQKVKLFLCSRDVKIGDKVRWKDKVSEIDIPIDEKNWHWLAPHAPWSMIGEISPEAKVQEGDEFDYGEVQISYSCEKGDECDLNFGDQLCSAPHKILNLIKIKCPWGHFH